MRIIALALALALAAPAVSAEPVSGSAARKMLFSPKGNEVQVASGGFVDANVAAALKQGLAAVPYYGAVAVSPGEPTSSNLMATMANFHSVAAAEAAALENCNARRTSGGPCVVIATVTPKRYKPQPLTLSAEATAAFGSVYRKLKDPKGMAISPATGAFGIERGDGARAQSICADEAKKAGAADCQIVISD